MLRTEQGSYITEWEQTFSAHQHILEFNWDLAAIWLQDNLNDLYRTIYLFGFQSSEKKTVNKFAKTISFTKRRNYKSDIQSQIHSNG